MLISAFRCYWRWELYRIDSQKADHLRMPNAKGLSRGTSGGRIKLPMATSTNFCSEKMPKLGQSSKDNKARSKDSLNHSRLRLRSKGKARLSLLCCCSCFAMSCGVCVCVSVKPCYQGIPFCGTHAGGHSMSLGLCPTKLPVAREEMTDHPLVPAICQAPVLTRLEQPGP